MDWLIIGVSSACLFAAISIVDKILLERYFKNNWAYPFFTALFLGFYSLLILGYRLAVNLFEAPSLSIILIALLPGFLHYAAALVTTRALRQADASTVFGLSQINPFFAMLWGIIVFGNYYKPINYVGVFILVVSAVFLAWEKPQRSIKVLKFNRVLLLVLLGTFIRSFSDLILKISVTELAFWDAFALSRVGSLFPAFLLLTQPKIRQDIITPIISGGKRLIGIAGLVEIFALTNLILMTLAFSLGPLALVSATQATMPLFILIFTVLLNRIRKGLVPTLATGVSFQTRVLLGLGIVLGVLLIYM
jgi:drug/metabolite transporter (DMT)-like permease